MDGPSDTGWIDLHAHVLVGIDDGPDDLDAAMALARALVQDGVTTVCATPHVQPYPYRTTAEERDEAMVVVREELQRRHIDLDVVQGGELDLEFAGAWDDEELARFTLGDSRALLIEFPWVGGWPLTLAPTCRNLVYRGFRPVIAHPERARVVQAHPERLEETLAVGAVCQVTAASIVGDFGSSARDCAFTLLRSGRAQVISTDSHNADGRGPMLRQAHAVLAADCGIEFADAVFDSAPHVVMEGRIPALPAPVSRRRGLLRRRAG